jgi:hypothetical protein
MRNKEILLVSLAATAAIGAFIVLFRRRRRFRHHPRVYTPPRGVAGYEFTI